MENASKALLIAAAILIVIILIAFGVRVVSSPQATIEAGTNTQQQVDAKSGEARDSVNSTLTSLDLNF